LPSVVWTSLLFFLFSVYKGEISSLCFGGFSCNFQSLDYLPICCFCFKYNNISLRINVRFNSDVTSARISSFPILIYVNDFNFTKFLTCLPRVSLKVAESTFLGSIIFSINSLAFYANFIPALSFFCCTFIFASQFTLFIIHVWKTKHGCIIENPDYKTTACFVYMWTTVETT
jgi:hypothetical protein